MKTAILFALVGLASAACPNGCSGNGICGANDKCSCFQNWQGPDCSLRTCPYSLAWADTADGTNSAHYYAECSNKGVCDRKTGECKCFDGYEAKGCRRSTCPEGCSGHGTCEYIDELAGDFYDRRTGPGARMITRSGTSQGRNQVDTASNAQAVSNAVTDSDNTRQYHGFLYQLWDAQKIQGCKCDLGYSGPDCASRVAPKGDDPLTTVKSTMMTQSIQIGATTDPAGSAVGAPGSNPTFATDEFFIIYHDPYGGVWRTDGIAGSSDDTVVAARVKSALQALPNEVLEGVDVSATTAGVIPCSRPNDGGQHIPSNGGHGTANSCTNFCPESTLTGLAPNQACAVTNAPTAYTMDFSVTFADKPGQTGVQNLLEVVATAHKGTSTGAVGGAFPMSNGVTSAAAVFGGLSVSVVEVMTGTVVTTTGGYGVPDVGNISELAECSDRGLDNGDGECECFDGFRGLACEEQKALV